MFFKHIFLGIINIIIQIIIIFELKFHYLIFRINWWYLYSYFNFIVLI